MLEKTNYKKNIPVQDKGVQIMEFLELSNHCMEGGEAEWPKFLWNYLSHWRQLTLHEHLHLTMILMFKVIVKVLLGQNPELLVYVMESVTRNMLVLNNCKNILLINLRQSSHESFPYLAKKLDCFISSCSLLTVSLCHHINNLKYHFFVCVCKLWIIFCAKFSTSMAKVQI